MKHRRMRVSARTATKSYEKELIERARALMNNPELILPKCAGECKQCPFESIRIKMKKIYQKRESKFWLNFYSKWGEHTARAYACSIMLAKAGKAPYLAVVNLPTGEVQFAVRGKVKREKLIGVQNYHHPELRMLAIGDIARENGLNIYSTNEGLVCSGKDPSPPKEFAKEAISSVKTYLREFEGVYCCDHLEPKDVSEKRPSTNAYLRIDWHSAKIVIGICKKCAKNSKDSTFATLTRRAYIPKVNDDFTISVVARPNCCSECKKCYVKYDYKVTREHLTDYIEGEISDWDILSRHLEKLSESLKGLEEKIFVIGDDCYGKDVDKFIESLKPNEDEKEALQAIFKKYEGPAVLERATPGKIISDLWQKYGKAALYAVTGDKEFAKGVFEKADITNETPAQILKEARVKIKQRDLLSSLPKYEKLPLVAKFADEMTKIYMTRGAEDTVRAIERMKEIDTSVKSVAYAFLLAMGKETSKKWQYTKHEIEFAEYLKPAVKDLLNANADNYHEMLQKVLSSTGSTEKIEKAKV